MPSRFFLPPKGGWLCVLKGFDESALIIIAFFLLPCKISSVKITNRVVKGEELHFVIVKHLLWQFFESDF